MTPLLDVQDLRVRFATEAGEVHAVDGVSFSLEKGRTLGLVGESGCGKSVTAMSILGVVPEPPGRMAGGRILWKGRDLLSLSRGELQSVRGGEIAMIFQDPMTSLNPVFPVGKILLDVLRTRYGLKGRSAKDRAAEALGSVGLPDPMARLANYPHELSGGMKQRILIALALLSEPELLIADEPTTALDVTIQKQVLHLIATLQKKNGMALLLITHNLGVVAETCDDVAVMYAGRIVERCDVQTLFDGNMHPYTRGLLESVPSQRRSRSEPLPTIEGTVPSLMPPPAGCRFAGRCFRRQPLCDSTDPTLSAQAPGHFAACHFPLEERA